jgi:hypothetical protein
MSEVTKKIAAPLVEEAIQNIRIEILPCEVQNIDASLAPEINSGAHAAIANEETDSVFRPLPEITEQINGPTAAAAPASPGPVIHPIWPWVVLALGVVFTTVWIGLLGYGLVILVELVI